MDHRKKRRYILRKQYRADLSFVIIYIFIIAVLVYTFLGIQLKIWIFYGEKYCLLDCLHALEKPYYFGITVMPLTLFGILSGRKVFTYPAFILKYESCTKIWKLLLNSIVRRSVLFSVIFSSTACLFSALSSYTVVNWREESSMFYQITGTFYEGSAVYVILLFFLFNSIKFCLAALCFTVLENLSGDSLWSVLFLTTVVTIEWVSEDTQIFLNLFAISQTHFKMLRHSVWILLLGFGLLIILYLGGKKIWKEKEFYGK